jgi:uncharacterized protein (DUF1800 family)
MQQEISTQVETQLSPTDEGASAKEDTSGVQFSPAYLSLLGTALLAACGGSEESSTASAVKGGATASTTSTPPTSVGADASSAIRSQADLVNGYRPAGVAPNSGNYSAAGFNNFPSSNAPNEAARFLLQTQFNASDAEINAVSNTMFATYLQQQFAKPIGQTGWDWLEARGYGVADANTYFFNTYPAEFMLWNQLFTAQDGMRKRIALGLSEFFVASMQSAEFTWRSHAYAQYWDILVKNAFGNFRQLLEDVTLSPAMGYYLNTKGNLKENAATGRVPDENYGREVMQLFSIGLYKLNLDGTVMVDSATGKKLESYTQDDVTNIARVFTGYDFDTSDGVRLPVVGQTYTIESRTFTTKPMSFRASNHTANPSTFLGAATVAADNTGGKAVKQTLDILFNHPNVGPFFGKQMIQRFVTSNPSPAYVARVASAFNNNGAGVRGDLKAVWTAIFLDDEARRIYTPSGAAVPSPADPLSMRNAIGFLNRDISDKAFGKLREPMLRFIQWGRTFGATSLQNSWKLFSLSNAANQLGQSPFQSPSVFNFFRPGFVPPGTALAATQTTAPEFQLVNETTVGGYLNFMQNVIRTGLYCPEPTVPQAAYVNYLPDVQANYANELALVADPTALVNRLNLLLAAGQISATNQALMVTALSSMAINSATPATQANQKMDRVSAAILMVMACSEYLIQK